MSAATTFTGFFAIACTLQDVDPMLRTPIGEAHALSFIARNGTGAMVGWQGLDDQDSIAVSVTEGGLFRLSGAHFRDSKDPTWADLRPSGKDEFEMEWLMYDHLARDGRATVAVWSKGHCQRLASGGEAIQ